MLDLLLAAYDSPPVMMPDGAFWGMVGALTTIIILLLTISYQAGMAQNRLKSLLPKVEECIDHIKDCDTDRALSRQTSDNHETRIGHLEVKLDGA